MSQPKTSLTTAVALTGLTLLAGNGEVGEAHAATITQSETFTLSTSGTTSLPQGFSGFNPVLGTLTGVTFSLTSAISTGSESSAPFDATISVTPGQIVGFNGNLGGSTISVNLVTLSPVAGPGALSFYVSPYTVTWALSYSGGSLPATWSSTGQGLTATYTYTAAPPPPPPPPPPTAVPAPETLPLVMTGLAGLGLGAWRTRRTQKKSG